MKRFFKNIKWYITSFIHIFDGRGYCHEEESRIARTYYSQGNDNQRQTGGVVVMVDGRYLQGGLTDRLRGITSVYSYCKDKNIPFHLKFTSPFSLEKYLVPNQVDWRIAEDNICYDANKVKVCLLNDYEIPLVYHRLCLRKWLETGKELHLYTNTNFCDRDFHTCFHELFKPSPMLQKRLDACISQIGENYISISFRFTTLLGDFADCINAPLPDDEQLVLIDKCLDAISAISTKAPIHDRILVTADSEKFLKAAAKLPKVYIVPGNVGHFDHSCNEEKEMKTFLDYLLIAKAQAVYLGRSGAMYRSGFARHAAMIGGKPFHEYEF